MKSIYQNLTALFALAGLLVVGQVAATAAESHGDADKAAHHEKDGGDHDQDADHAEGHDDHAHAGHGHGASEYGPAGEPTLGKRFGYSYLVAYMFFLSICLGSWFIILLNQLMDTQWIVPIRRYLEHLACMLGLPMGILFIPILILAPTIYPWFSADPHLDHALHAKWPLFTKPAFYAVSIGLFFVWGYITNRLRYWSLQQDVAESETGGYEGKMGIIESIIAGISTKLLGHTVEERPAVRCSRMMNIHASYGIVVFAPTLTLAAIYWVKGLQHQWFSTMYGVYYFAGSVWVTLATAYLLAIWLKQNGPLEHVVRRVTFHDTGKLFFAFTVFYAYIHFSQYFLIWNAAIPEETFWYVQRERGSWWWIGQLIIFGHFFLPFLLLLRIDTKCNLDIMIPMGVWAWLMHYLDMHFNIMPVLYPAGISFGFFDILSVGFIGVVLWILFNNAYSSHPPYPQRDPRIAETMGVYVEPEGGETAVSN